MQAHSYILIPFSNFNLPPFEAMSSFFVFVFVSIPVTGTLPPPEMAFSLFVGLTIPITVLTGAWLVAAAGLLALLGGLLNGLPAGGLHDGLHAEGGLLDS